MKKGVLLLKALLTFIIILLIGNLLLFLVSLIPSKYIEENVIKSADILLRDGNNYAVFGFLPIDNYVNSLIINEAYGIDSEDPVTSYMTMKRNYKKGITKTEIEMPTGKGFEVKPDEIALKEIDLSRELTNFLNDKLDVSVRYGRYWHGYMVLYRPLLMIFNISQIRVLLFGVALIFFILNFFKIKAQHGKKIALLYLIIYLLAGGLTGVFDLGSSPLIIITLIANYLVVSKKIKNYKLFYFTLGIIGNFFDFLTVPLLCVGMPIIFEQLSIKDKNNKDRIIDIVLSLICFFAGWGLMWVAKFVIYALIVDSNTISDIITQIIHRMSNKADREEANVAFLFQNLLGRFFAIVFVYLSKWIIKTKCKIDKRLAKEYVWLLFIALLPFILLMVMFNHMITHAYLFTYRNFVVSAFCICLYLMKIREKRLEDEKNKCSNSNV